MKKIIVVLCMLVELSWAATPDALTSVQQERFQSLTNQLRCLVCQNENLTESNAKLAVDLRHQISQKIQNGQSDQEIIHYLISRYGDYILYRPPFNPFTLGLWLGPFFILIMSIACLIYYLKINRLK